MDGEIKKIDSQIRELKKKKMDIQNKKKKEKLCNGTNYPNKIIRVAIEFNKELEDINTKREENGLCHLSIPELTRLFIKYKGYSKEKEDMISYNPELGGKDVE